MSVVKETIRVGRCEEARGATMRTPGCNKMGA